MIFVNRVADIANGEDHHPDILINYSRVTLTLWTHAIGGLSENDFIVAAKASGLVPDHSPPTLDLNVLPSRPVNLLSRRISSATFVSMPSAILLLLSTAEIMIFCRAGV